VEGVQRPGTFLKDVNRAGVRTQVAAPSLGVGAEGEDGLVNLPLASHGAAGST